jgi:hypothetical protein
MLRLAINFVAVFLGLGLVVHAGGGPLDSSEGELFSAGYSIPIAESHRFGPLARGEGGHGECLRKRPLRFVSRTGSTLSISGI